jgi:hypothetical protein
VVRLIVWRNELNFGFGTERNFGSMAARHSLPALAALTLLFAACRDPKVAAYRVPKEKEPEAPAAAEAGDTPSAPNGPATPPAAAGANANMAATPVATATGAGLIWTAPATWKTKAASAMRKGSYAIGEAGAEADLSITAFPGDVGGELANINRWRGQVSLPPLAGADVAAAVTRLNDNGLSITIVDFAGTGANAQRVLGAIVPFEGATWFFKLLGPDAVVARARPEFLAFIKTVKAARVP